jgi:hypothetical protein
MDCLKEAGMNPDQIKKFQIPRLGFHIIMPLKKSLEHYREVTNNDHEEMHLPFALALL